MRDREGGDVDERAGVVDEILPCGWRAQHHGCRVSQSVSQMHHSPQKLDGAGIYPLTKLTGPWQRYGGACTLLHTQSDGTLVPALTISVSLSLDSLGSALSLRLVKEL